MNIFTGFVEIRYRGLPLKLVWQFRYLAILTQLSMHMDINGVFHEFHKSYHRFCWNSAWETNVLGQSGISGT
jgi:hypothetical protein